MRSRRKMCCRQTFARMTIKLWPFGLVYGIVAGLVGWIGADNLNETAIKLIGLIAVIIGVLQFLGCLFFTFCGRPPGDIDTANSWHYSSMSDTEAQLAAIEAATKGESIPRVRKWNYNQVQCFSFVITLVCIGAGFICLNHAVRHDIELPVSSSSTGVALFSLTGNSVFT